MVMRQGGGPYGLGGAVAGSGSGLALVKRGQNVGYQSYMLIFPEIGQACRHVGIGQRHDLGNRSHPSCGGGLSLAVARGFAGLTRSRAQVSIRPKKFNRPDRREISTENQSICMVLQG
jgi:hypothetical protein